MEPRRLMRLCVSDGVRLLKDSMQLRGRHRLQNVGGKPIKLEPQSGNRLGDPWGRGTAGLRALFPRPTSGFRRASSRDGMSVGPSFRAGAGRERQ